MKIINPNTEGIKEAVKKILKGEIIFIPTDTVYGIAASPYNNRAINHHKLLFLSDIFPVIFVFLYSSNQYVLKPVIKIALTGFPFSNCPNAGINPKKGREFICLAFIDATTVESVSTLL